MPSSLKGTFGNPPYKQGSKAWITDYAYELIDTPGQKHIGEAILKGLDDGNVFWYEVRSNIKNGVVENVEELLDVVK